MTWYIWPLGLLILLIMLYLLRRYYTKFRMVTFWDLATLPSWLAMHFTMGFAFGYSFIIPILLLWLVIGMILAIILLRRNWPVVVFWHRYWQWSGLLALLLEIIVSITALTLHLI
ncbi:DUF3397 domain-containing protein [Eupransor demetentiae]|uniref:Integral membrane protein n=1 Tax=Eupransor demetentiae TaxID=3109584 RepID=A0ABP0ER17_9LACO|nr:hypothetical protein R54876_GBNLAHCA_00772 [Lactobacillaceae bacterium LMG 33000]